MKKFSITIEQIEDFLDKKVRGEFIDSIGSNLQGCHQDIFLDSDTNELYITGLLSQGDMVETDDEYITMISAYTEFDLEICLDELFEDEKLAVLEKINEEEHKHMTLEELKNNEYDYSIEIYRTYEKLYPEEFNDKKEEYMDDRWSSYREVLRDVIIDATDNLNKN
ncbi:MAG: hypothetical protein ACLR02_13215 [Clostridium sp.]